MKHAATLLLAAMLFVMSPAHAESKTWNFRVLLDGKPIGSHRFDLTHFHLNGQDDQYLLRSEAAFAVKLLGITLYRYQHQASERWQGDCLRALESSTDDDGKLSTVALDASDLPPCIMSYAYWNPRLLQQTRVVNTQTGRINAVQVSSMGTSRIQVRGETVSAHRWRITGLQHPIDLWYGTGESQQGDTQQWLGLDSHMGDRLLSYRLE